MFDFIILASAIIFISLDFIYLNLIKGYFFNQIKIIQNSEPKINFLGALLCYIFLIIGINYFIIIPNKSINDAFLLGIVIYGVYETTNYTLFKNWSIYTVLIDTLWGGILFAATCYLTNLIKKVKN
jgi:uncharacterized membrane protein